MELVVFIIIGFICYNAFQYYRAGTLNTLEKKGYRLHNQVINKLEKELKSNQETEEKIFHAAGYSEKEWLEKVEEGKKYLQQIRDMEEKFIRLKEKYKHQSQKQKREILLDWCDYNLSLEKTEWIQSYFKDVGGPEDPNEREKLGKDLRKEWLAREEIEKRFDKKLI